MTGPICHNYNRYSYYSCHFLWVQFLHIVRKTFQAYHILLQIWSGSWIKCWRNLNRTHEWIVVALKKGITNFSNKSTQLFTKELILILFGKARRSSVPMSGLWIFIKWRLNLCTCLEYHWSLLHFMSHLSSNLIFNFIFILSAWLTKTLTHWVCTTLISRSMGPEVMISSCPVQ